MSRSKTLLAFATIISLAVSHAAKNTDASDASYLIVVSKATAADPSWNEVVETLQRKHSGASVVSYEDNVSEILPALQNAHPKYTCFVATPSETSRQFVADVHRMTRRFDDDPYTDTLWGILTGYDAKCALSIAQHEQPLTIKKVASGTEVALDMCSEGVWYDELVQHKTVRREPGGGVAESRSGPADTTRVLAETLSEYQADLFVTSGHATERDWQIGFRYRNGSFRSGAGKMFGVTTENERFEITSDNPKVYLPIGNCLMGHIDGPDAMALAWMNSLGVRQMIGYTVVTWYGYGGWGVLDYFVEQPGRYTLTEAFHANHHALIHRLHTHFDAPIPQNFVVGGRDVSALHVNQMGRQAGLNPMDARGLLWDRDVVAFYGDPAWQARMEPQKNAYKQTLENEGDTYTLTITGNLGPRSFEPVNTNGAQRGWRPIVQFLPHRIGEAKIIEGGQHAAVIADDFILVPNPRKSDTTQPIRIRFTAQKASD